MILLINLSKSHPTKQKCCQKYIKLLVARALYFMEVEWGVKGAVNNIKGKQRRQILIVITVQLLCQTFPVSERQPYRRYAGNHIVRLINHHIIYIKKNIGIFRPADLTTQSKNLYRHKRKRFLYLLTFCGWQAQRGWDGVFCIGNKLGYYKI